MLRLYSLIALSLFSLILCCACTSIGSQQTRPAPLAGDEPLDDPSAIAVGQSDFPAIAPKTLLKDLEHPWGITWISDQQALITLRPGRVVIYAVGNESAIPISGVPDVFASGQGGLLDVAAHPEFDQNQWVYFSYAQGDRKENQTTVSRAKLNGTQLSDWETIFSVADPKSGTQHFGSRLLWLPDGTLLIAIGDGGNPPLNFEGDLIRNQAQNLGTHFGKVIRINADGSIPADNPFVRQSQAKPEIWSYGHRNIQGMAIDSKTGQVWSTEHGSRGGDELNLMNAGQNYGWPIVSHSREYHIDRNVAPRTSRPGFPDPKLIWTPSIAPSGLAVYRGDRYPGWGGNLFAGALVNRSIIRVAVDEKGNAQQLEELNIGQRVRDIRQGPDGYLYVLTDARDGRLLRLEPTS